MKISGLDVISALSSREQIWQCFHVQQCSRKLGGQGVCVYSWGWELTSRRKGSLPFLTSKLVGFGHRSAHRKFMFAKTAPWDFPVLPAWPLFYPCSTLTSSMSLLCKIIVISAGFYWLLNSLKKLDEKNKRKIRLICNWQSHLNEWMKLLFQSTIKAYFVGSGIKPIIWRWTCAGGCLGWILRISWI